MINKIVRIIFAICFVSSIIATPVLAKNPYINEAMQTINYYLDLIASHNYESAAGLWLPVSIKEADRLGIAYDGIGFKPDCLSPAVYHVEEYAAGVPSGIDSQAEINDTTLRFRFRLDVPNLDKASYMYYIVRTGGYFWLAYPHDIYASDWPVKKTKYFIFHIYPDKLKTYNEVAADAMDGMVESMAAQLNLDDKQLALLADKKIHFYLCSSPSEIVKLAGVQSVGAFRKDADAVFSTYITNTSPVADQLVNFKLKDLPFRSDNFMRSGLRAYLGGGWQRSPDVLIDFGEYIMKYDLIDLDTLLLTDINADNNTTDIALPAQACLTDYLISRFGLDNYLNCFTQISSIDIPNDSLKIRIIEGALARAFDADWDDIDSGLVKFVSESNRHGGDIFPGKIKTDKVLIDKNGVKVTSSDKWIQVTYTGDDNKLFDIGIVFGKDPRLVGISSELMGDQFKDTELYDGYRYGLRFDKNEIGIYDYAINRLVAKYVTSFDPSDDYYDASKNMVTAYFDKSLLGNNPPDMGDAIFIE